MRPGKKPATMAGAGKGLDVAVGVGVEDGFCVAGEFVPVELAGDEEELEGAVEVVVGETVTDELGVLDEVVELRMGRVVVGNAEEVLLPEIEEAAAPEAMVLAFITHALFWHEKPCGQQSLPHFAKGPPKSVLWIALSGCKVALFWVVSHVMGDIVWQSLWPAGQQITDALLLNCTHAWSVGQQ